MGHGLAGSGVVARSFVGGASAPMLSAACWKQLHGAKPRGDVREKHRG
ncbi:hypothetical protein [Lysobacter gummosus]